MTKQRSPRSMPGRIAVAAFVTLALALAATIAFAQDLEAYRPQIEQLLADEAVVAIELGDRWRTVEPTEQTPWPDAGAMELLRHAADGTCYEALIPDDNWVRIHHKPDWQQVIAP